MPETTTNLKFRRTVSFNRLQEVYNYMTTKTDDQFYQRNFLARAEFVDAIYNDFQKTHNEIISLIVTDKDFSAQDKIRSQEAQYFYDIKARSHECKDPNISSPVNVTNSSFSGARLPKINMPTFEGDLTL